MEPSMSVTEAIREAAVFDNVEQSRLWVDELGFSIGSCDYSPEKGGRFTVRGMQPETFWYEDMQNPGDLAHFLCWIPLTQQQAADLIAAWATVWMHKQPC